MDKLQRVKLSKEEQDSAYISTTELIDVINDLSIAEKSLNQLKEELQENIKMYDYQEFDIFGNIEDNRLKTKNLGNQKHRENKKDKFKILGITKITELEEYKNRIQEIKRNLNESFNKIKSKYDMSIYVISRIRRSIKTGVW